MRIQGVPYPLKPRGHIFPTGWPGAENSAERIRTTNILQWKKTTMNEDAYGKWTSSLLNNHTSRRFTSSFLVVFPWWNISFKVFFPHFENHFEPHLGMLRGNFRHHCLYFNVPPVMWWILVVFVIFGTFRIWTRTMKAMKLRSRLCMYYVVYIYTKLHNIFIYIYIHCESYTHITNQNQFHTSLTHSSGQANAFQIDQGVYLPKASGCCWDAYVSW